MQEQRERRRERGTEREVARTAHNGCCSRDGQEASVEGTVPVPLLLLPNSLA